MWLNSGRILLLCVGAAVASSWFGEETSEGLAPLRDSSVLVDGSWRFTAVTDRLIRIEYDEEQKFVDEPTVTFTRAPPRGAWVSSQQQGVTGWSVLKTASVVVQYKKDMRPSNDSLKMFTADGSHKWTWGDDPADGNLRGTARTLDGNAETLDLNCHHKVSSKSDNSQQHCSWGLVSRHGWAVVNDTGAPIWKDNWIAPSRNTTADISVFLHGLDFSGALQDFIYSAGKPALPPRYALGSMFTRWYNFDEDSVTSMVEEFESRSFPLDAWIFDMNWHHYGPWGSFSWNSDSFPHSQDLLDWMQSKKLPVGANFHEHDGISTAEVTYKQVAAALGRAGKENIPFDLYNKSYAMAQENISVWNVSTQGRKQGIDFSWIDYQQGEDDHFQQTTIPNLNPTITLNALRSSLQRRMGKNNLRSLIVARWGGLGSHRYPVGFSGDQMHDWKGLSFLPYFTSTAANVAFNYWSHDTVGGDHDLATDYELSVRWVQTSAWSPVLRFHDKGAGTGGCSTSDVCARVVPWELPSAFYKPVWEAVRVRDELLPYIYTAAFNSTFSGAALTRPMYYENPSEDLYGLDHQYLFGPDMIISPITAPSSPDAKGFEQALGANTWSVYAPSPRNGIGWVDRLNGDFAAGENVTNVYGIRDVPGFERQGAVVPYRPRLTGESSLARAQRTLDAIEFRISPAFAFYTGGKISGSGVVVDDDGMTTDYLQDKITKTTLEYAFEGRTFKIKLSQTGNFSGRPETALVRLAFPQLPPMVVKTASVGAGGKVLSATKSIYDHKLIGSVLTIEQLDLQAGASLELEISPTYSDKVLPNFVGLLGKVRRARYAKDAMDAMNIPYGVNRLHIKQMALAAIHMSPDFADKISHVWQNATQEAAALLRSSNLKNDPRRSRFISEILLHRNASSKTIIFV